MKNIVLIGMRGSGKSHVGKLLAERLKMDFFDSDAEVEQQAKKSIVDIVASDGWETFREWESRAVRRLAKRTNTVIATGGGVVLREENIAALKKTGVIVFLNVPLPDLRERISGKDLPTRPSLTGKSAPDELVNIWESRKDAYFSAADIVVDCPNISSDKRSDVQQHTEEIIEQLASRGIGPVTNSF